MQRRFHFAVVTDRETVLCAARSLMLRMASLREADRQYTLARVAA